MKKLIKILFALALFAIVFVPTAIASLSIFISVSATQGTLSSNYLTLKGAFDAINAGTHQGAITINIIRSTTETASAVLNASGSGSASYTSVNIYPTVTGLTISGNLSSNPVIRLAGANHVTIDGSVNATGNLKDLTITNTTATSPRAIMVNSSGTTPITDVTIKNCVVINGVNTQGTAIAVSDIASPTTAGYFNNITIRNNSVQKAYYGINAQAVVAAGNGSGLLITGNEMTASGANGIGVYGIIVTGVDGATVSNNTISNMSSSDAISPKAIVFAAGTSSGTISGNTITNLVQTNTGNYTISGIVANSGASATAINITGNTIQNLTSSGILLAFTGISSNSPNTNITDNVVSGMTQNGAASFWGIAQTGAANSTCTGNTVSGLTTATTGNVNGINIQGASTGVTISGNHVYDIKNTNNIGGSSARGISLQSTSASSNITVANNIVHDIAGYGWASYTQGNGYGIAVLSGNGYNIYFNTISLASNQTQEGYPASLFIGSTVTSPVDVRNNIFSNSQTTGTNRYAVICNAANTVFSNIDYNDYYTTGLNLGYIGATNRVDLADWKTGTGKDVKSSNVLPGFANATGNAAADYLPSEKFMVGVSGIGVTTDYAGTARTFPAKGAYEYEVSSTFVWKGSVNNSWNTAGNWNSNAVPTATDNIQVPDVTTDPIIDLAPASPAICNNLTIESGAVITIPAGKALTVNGTLTNNAGISGLVVQSASGAADGTGSLINGTAGVPGTVERYVSGDLWHLISPAATAGETVANFVLLANGNLVARNATNYALAPWLEATGKWDYYKVSGSNTSGQYGTPAKGFQVLRATGAGTGTGSGSDGGKLTFKGTLAAADQNIAVTKSLYGWNLIGNPYPCALDIEKFIAANTALLDPSYVAIYVSNIGDVAAKGYSPVILADGLKLASGEGFFVKAKTGGETINFTTAMKSSVSAPFKAATVDIPAIRLTAENGNAKLGTTVEYIGGATKGLDPGIDAGLFNGTASTFSVFTRLIDDNGVDFTIQALPDNKLESMVIPVGLVADQGATVTFKALATNLPAGYKVVLEDKQTNTFTRLDEANTSYTVSLDAATLGTGRFYLHTTEIVSAIDESLLNDFKVVPISEQNLVRIIGNFDLPAKAMIYDMNGKLVATAVLTSQIENNISLTNSGTGVYLLKVETGRGMETVKFVWKRK